MSFIKRNKLFVSIIAGLLVIVLVIVGFSFGHKEKAKPEDVLRQSISSLKADIEKGKNPIWEEMQMKELLNYARNNPTSMYADINIDATSLQGLLPGDSINLKTKLDIDPVNKNNAFDLAIGVANTDLINITETKVGDELFLAVPTFLDNTYQINLKNIIADYQSSAWKGMLGVDLSDDSSALAEMNSYKNEVLGYAENIQKELSDIMENHKESLKAFITYSKEKNVIYMTVDKDEVNAIISEIKDSFVESETLNTLLDKLEESRNNNIVKYGHIDEGFVDDFDTEMPVSENDEEIVENNSTKSKADIINEINNFMDIHLSEDLVIEFVMDNNSNITSIRTVSGNTLDNEYLSEFGFELKFMGEEIPASDISAKWYVYSTNDAELNISFTSANGNDENTYWNNTELYLEFIDENGEEMSAGISTDCSLDRENNDFVVSLSSQANDTNSYVEIEGTIDDYVAGKSLKVALGELYIEENDEKQASLSGTFEIKPMEEEISKPEKSVAFFEMTEEDIQNMMEELQTNLGTLIEAMSGASIENE